MMQDFSGRMSKNEAITELDVQLELGKRLLARGVEGEDGLAEANAERVAWAMATKKIIYHLFGDATEFGRLTPLTPAPGERALRPTLEQEIRQFQQLVAEQLVSIEKVLAVLRQN